MVNGCVKDENGALRIVVDPADCTSRETPISWNQVGPQGEPGMDGEPGADGAPGQDGTVLPVIDVIGAKIGISLGGLGVFHEPSQTEFPVDFSGSVVPRPFIALFLEDVACERTPLIEAGSDWVGGKLLDSGMGFVALVNGVPHTQETIRAAILGFDGACEPRGPEDRTVSPARMVDLGLTFPLPTPLYAAPAPEAGP